VFRRGTSAFNRTPRGGRAPARIRVALSEPGTVRFTDERLLPGRRSGGRCVAPTRRTRVGARCVRAVRGDSAVLALPAGVSAIPFSGRLARPLAPGRHRLVALAADAAGNRSAARRTTFTLLTPGRR
jgi:hypothetical protein